MAKDWICRECFTDEALQDYIDGRVEHNHCDFCDRHSGEPIAASFPDVADYIYQCLLREYDNPANGIAWEGKEGGWQGATISDTYDLLVSKLEATENNKVVFELQEHFGQYEWCSKEFYGATKSERLTWRWEGFCEAVKHRTRYVFFRSDDRVESNTLDRIARAVNSIQGMVKISRQTIFRARQNYKRKEFKTASELGTPPLKAATHANRMSPPGIAMFYGALDIETAVCEIRDKISQDHAVAVGEFVPIQPLRLLDLALLPAVPSIFVDEEVYYKQDRQALIFLHNFARDISRPIKKDKHQHIEYVPTQVLTEYYRHLFTDNDGNKLDGILYRSAQKIDGISCVLFFESENCCDTGSCAENCRLNLSKYHQVDSDRVQEILSDNKLQTY